MQFAIFFSQQCPRPWGADTERTLFHNALEQAEIADRIGIQGLWAQEHHFLEEYSHSSAPEVFLGAVTQRTRRIRIGHGITLMPPAFNHPARVAERIATLDLLSDGRVEWGTGESGTRLELEGFGVPYAQKRIMWTEAVQEAAKMMCSEPYPGFNGRSFSMPPRNVVPKPLQAPHPPISVACTSRDSIRHAAQCGVGALTFAFMDSKEAHFWVNEYYETFERHCRNPVGQAVNPNIAMLSQFMCHPDRQVAVEQGLPGSKFFAFGLSHYYKTGTHTPGASQIWSAFERTRDVPHAGNEGIGTPEDLRTSFRRLEEAGVDQLILLHQAGRNRHDDVCASLELFGREVLPEFLERDDAQQRSKARRLEPSIERALAGVPGIESKSETPVVESYPVWSKNQGADATQLLDRGGLAPSIWKLQVARSRKPRTRR